MSGHPQSQNQARVLSLGNCVLEIFCIFLFKRYGFKRQPLDISKKGICTHKRWYRRLCPLSPFPSLHHPVSSTGAGPFQSLPLVQKKWSTPTRPSRAEKSKAKTCIDQAPCFPSSRCSRTHLDKQIKSPPKIGYLKQEKNKKVNARLAFQSALPFSRKSRQLKYGGPLVVPRSRSDSSPKWRVVFGVTFPEV